MKKMHNIKIQIRKSFKGLAILTALFTGQVLVSNAQTTSTFDNLTLSPNSYWNGSDLSGGFTSGNAYFKNTYNTTYNVWAGFAYSSMTDITTAGYTNQYSAYTGIGYNASSNYAVSNAYAPSMIKLTAPGSIVNGFYVTNTTYAGLSMKNGDSFAKKFGGTSGNDPDWFKLSITGYAGGSPISDSVHFYLADFRFANNTQDYILNTWEWVNLTGLGNVDSLSFSLSSSDVGAWGMNTPAYFAMDNFNGAIPLAINQNISDKSFAIFPNPAISTVNIDLGNIKANKTEIRIADITGLEVYNNTIISDDILQIPVNELQNGIYIITIQSDGNSLHQKFIKQ